MEYVKTNYNVTVTRIDKLRLNQLRRKVIKTYQKLGETDNSIDKINHLLGKFHQDFKQSMMYKTSMSQVYQARKNGNHQHFKVHDDELIKLSLHVMPRGTQVPMHAHPGMFSMILVKQGILQIRHDSWGRQAPLAGAPSVTSLAGNQVSVGLPVKNNLHQIRAESEYVVFYSLRFKLKSQQPIFSQKKHYALPGIIMGLVLPFISMGGASNAVAFNEGGISTGEKDYAKLVLASEKAVIYQNADLDQVNRNSKKMLANKMRNSDQYEQQVEAVQYYQKAARAGDAECQYWLGVMFLDGSGITEDDDAALEWIAKSAAQNYPPAEKLLVHLLATDFDMDC